MGFYIFFCVSLNGINEKFDIKTNQWSLFNSQTINYIEDVYLFKKFILYFIYGWWNWNIQSKNR